MTIQDFKDCDEYYEKLCRYYMEGIDLLVKWMAKHHLNLGLSGLVVDNVEKELMSDRPSKVTTENVMEEDPVVAKGMKEATVVTPVNPIPNEQ